MRLFNCFLFAAAIAAQSNAAQFVPLPVDAQTSALSADSTFVSANNLTTTSALATALQNYATTSQLALKADASVLQNYATKTYADNLTPKFYNVLVDTSPTVAYLSGTKIDFFATDAELKVMSGDTMVYWASSLQNDNFKTHAKADANCKIWFQCSEVVGDESGGRRWWPFAGDIFGSVAEQARAMSGWTASQGYPAVGNILFSPNVAGTLNDETAINTIWNINNAALYPTVLRFNGVTCEQTASGKNRWRIANPKAINTGFEQNVFFAKQGFDTGWTSGSRVVSATVSDGVLTLKTSGNAGWTAPAYKTNVNLSAGKRYLVMVKLSARLNSDSVASTNIGGAIKYDKIVDIKYVNLTSQWSEWSFAKIVTAPADDREFGLLCGNGNTVGSFDFKNIVIKIFEL